MADPTEFGQRAFSAVNKVLKDGQEIAKRQTKVIRLQTQISRLRSQRQQLFQEMGEKVFDLFQRDLVKNQELRRTCQQIRSLDAEIEMRREEVEQLRRPESRGEGGIDLDPNPASDLLADDDEEIIRG